MSEQRSRSGARFLLAVAASLCVLAVSAGTIAADAEIESYDRAVASHSKQDALAFIKAYPSSVLIGYLFDLLTPETAQQVCTDLGDSAPGGAQSVCYILQHRQAEEHSAGKPHPQPQFQCVLSQFQGVQNELSQFADDANSAAQGSASDTSVLKRLCLQMMALAASGTALAMKFHPIIHEDKTIDRGKEVALISRIEGTLTLNSEIISTGSCSDPDSLLFTYRQKLLQLDDRVSECLALLKAELSAR
jgi:hypothetical protein